MSKVIAIDIGHGANTYERGGGKGVKVGGKVYEEHTFNSQVGIHLDRLLKENGFETVMYQKPFANEVGLTARTNYYNRLNVDLVWSIHANASGNRSVSGACAFYWEGFSAPQRLASLFAEERRKAGYGTHGNGLHVCRYGSWTNLHITRETNMTAVLTENGFMTNPSDFKKIFLDKNYPKEVATMHAKAICRFYGVAFKGSRGGSSDYQPNLSRGDRGPYVRKVQEILRDKGYDLAIDGSFGPKTEETVKEFQKDEGIKVDGLVGPQTWEHLLQVEELYRVRKSWQEGDTQKGAFQELANAIDLAKNNPGYEVYDENGEQVWPKEQVYRVRKSWDEASSQIGAFHELQNAKDLAEAHKKEGYEVYDHSGKVVFNPEVEAASTKQDPWYRVRKSWDDADTQKGAFKELEHAKASADNNKGYKVFNEQGEVIYVGQYKEDHPQHDYDEGSAIDIHAEHHEILGESEASLEQMIYYVEKNCPNAPEDIAIDFYEIGRLEGVRGDVALAQAIKETGYFNYGGDVKPEQNNFCGLGAIGGGEPGHSFSSVREGVKAQIQHLKGYATSNPLKLDCVDPRYKYIDPLGKAPHVEDLAGKWAVPGYEPSEYSSLIEAMKANDGYGHQIMQIVEQIKDVDTSDFEEPTEKTEEKATEEAIDAGLLNKVLQMIYELLTSLFKKNK